MSRNLCRSECCGKHEYVQLLEKPRPITAVEAGYYFDEYEGMLVANAECIMCCAQYLAWVDERPRVRGHYPSSWAVRFAREGYTYYDLSYRSSFNDEPGIEDLPLYHVVVDDIGAARVGLIEHPERDCYWGTWADTYPPDHPTRLKTQAEREKWIARREAERKSAPQFEPDYVRALRGATIVEIKGDLSHLHRIIVEKDGRRFTLTPDYSAVIIVGRV